MRPYAHSSTKLGHAPHAPPVVAAAAAGSQGVVVLFEGDQVADEDARALLGDTADAEAHLRLLAAPATRFRGCHAAVLGPDRVTHEG